MVSEPGFDNLYLNAGKVSLFFGNTLISPIPSWSFEGDQAEAKLGYSLTSVNHNDDIYDDVLLSQPFYDNGQTDEGRVLLFNGNESVFPAIPSWINESNLANAQYGFSMASAGDLNNDGYGDFAIGGIYNEFDKTDEGTVDLFYGTHYGAGMVKNAVIKGGQTSSKFGYSTASAGDVNGDGNDELLIGAPLFDNGLTDQGLISVLYGDTSTCIYDFNFLSLSTDETNAHIVFDDKAVTRRYDIRWKTFYDINWQYEALIQLDQLTFRV
ncbi:MAG: FG-GAP repeat protein [Bacteroidetes bacterium]|nr:FG-GAP repeat protein [Bacteroidota bacterium]